MADQAIGELIRAQAIGATDLFVLEQSGTAKCLTGQVLLNWLTSAADGHGGIQSIEKLSTSGLVDTYRITLADTTTFDFAVTNGRSITGISKTSTSGLVDTYTISYNDGTTGTFTIKNGEKGDKGDNAYIWIKYASQEPTESSHSIGDIPDDWIGIYSGNASTAPTDWQQYKWYKIKGEKGDTGAPATIASQSVTYQVSDSGTIIPSGSWGSSVPVVSQGKYLWTKTELQFNTGDPVVSYSVARMGMDGSGSVSSVAGVPPDATGNVTLTASNVGALAVSGGDMEGAIDMNGQPISGLNDPTEVTQAARKGYVDASVRKASHRNILDNSDFRNPVNQRGLQEYTSNGYSIDRWTFEKQDNVNALLAVQRVEDGFPEDRIYLQVGSGGLADFYQNLENYDKMAGKRYTLAVNIKGVVYAQVFTMGSNAGGISLGNDGAVFYSTPNKHVLIRSTTAPGFNMLWMALYEGEYTAETLPEYQPKGYGAELAECIRYYRKSYDGNNIKSTTGVVSIKPANANWLCTVNFDTPMRAVPTITLYSPVTGKVGCVSDFHTDVDTETVSVTATRRNFAIMLPGGFNEDHSYYFNYEASADL